MNAPLNEPLRKCDECGKLLDVKIDRCWLDPFTPDHKGLCCDCFDVSFGMRPPIVLGLRTAVRWDDEIDED